MKLRVILLPQERFMTFFLQSYDLSCNIGSCATMLHLNGTVML